MMKKHIFKILILGDTGVGKTSIMNQYVNKRFSGQYKATIGADFMTKNVVVDDKSVTLQVWDTAGQERFQSLGVAFYRGSDACVLVFDITSEKTFDNLNMWKEEFLTQASPKNPDDFPFIILGNKCDEQSQRVVSEMKINYWCKTRNLPYFGISAKDNINIEQAFTELVKKCVAVNKTPIEFPEVEFSNFVDLDKDKKIKSGCC